MSSPDWEKARAATTAPARLFSLRAYNKGAASFWLQVYDATAAPSDQSALVGVYECYAGGFIGDEFKGGKVFDNGIYVLAATTQTGTTLIAADDARFSVDFTAR